MTTTPVVLSVSDVRPIDLVSFPVGFTFRDDDGQAVITISDEPAEQHNHLEISNTSGGDLLLDAPPDGSHVSAGHHHFELRFRPGVLSPASITQMRVDDQSGWSATTPQTLADGTVSVYLLSATARTIAMDAPLRFRLSAVGADGANGARGTQLELRFRLRFPDGTPLEDTKLLHVDLANQRGRKNIPLHVGFVGSHAVLNDGRTPNSLDVRITNAAPTELRLSGQDSPSPSRFIVSFDVSSGANDGDLGLASASALAGSRSRPSTGICWTGRTGSSSRDGSSARAWPGRSRTRARTSCSTPGRSSACGSPTSSPGRRPATPTCTCATRTFPGTGRPVRVHDREGTDPLRPQGQCRHRYGDAAAQAAGRRRPGCTGH
jgi:hypothetical protein